METPQYLMTDIFRHTSMSACRFSPGTTFFAVAVEDHIIIRVTKTMQLVRTWACRSDQDHGSSSARPDIKQLEWSPDSKYILACAPRSGLTWIFGLADVTELPVAIITAGIEGLARVEWSPDSTAVLCFSEQRLRLTVNNLTGAGMSYIENFKAVTGCHAYRHDRRYLAIAEQHKGKETLAIYDAGDMYNLIRSFPISTQDVQGVSWSPCGRWIAVWDQQLEYTLHVYSPLGPRLSTFSSSSPSFIGPDPGLGVRMVSWGPGGNWLGIGGYDGKVRIVEADGWRCMSTLEPLRAKGGQTTVIWKEPCDWYEAAAVHGPISLSRTSGQLNRPTTNVTLGSSKDQVAISQLEWNADGTCLLIRNEAAPNLLYIFTFLSHPASSGPDTIRLQTALWLDDPIKQAKWNPSRALNFATITLPNEKGRQAIGSGVCIWEGDWDEEKQDISDASLRAGGSAVMVAMAMSDFEAHDIRWSPDGENLCILDKTQFCLLQEPTAQMPLAEASVVPDLSVIAE